MTDDRERLSILLVDASESDALLIRDLLAQGESDIPNPELVLATSADDGRRLARDARFDLVVIDSLIGDADGLELVRELRGGRVETPIVVLTGSGGEQNAVEALRAGATDYLSKAGLSVNALRRSVRYALDVARQSRLRREAEAALKLREEQLLETQRLETVATLSGGVAHEFNNLLNIVIGYGDMLRRRLPAGDPLHRHVDHILQASEKAASLTRQLLAFSRNQVLQPTLLDAGQLLKDMEAVVRSVVGRRVEVVVQADGVGCIQADRGQMEHSLLSLALNAKDAMPEGGRLTLSLRNAERAELLALNDLARPDAPHLALSLLDTGRGMTPEVQARAREPFFTTKGRANARGLGLSTVYGIVRQSGGQLRLSSQPGVGTEVTIYLPRVDAAGNAESAPLAAARGGGERILLVDDDAAMRSLLAESLREKGYSVEVAAGGSEALRAGAASDAPIDLLLTDVMMPGMSGTELAARFRELRPGVRVVYMSGATQEALRQRDGAIDAPFLWKPFSTEELTHAVRRALDEERR